jgi:transposase InsO family protein
MSRKGECLDNAPMESFFASLKKELVISNSVILRGAPVRYYLGIFLTQWR